MKRFLVLALRLGLLVIALGLVLHVVVPGVYRFPEPRPFQGPHWYNPYDGASHWLRGNFHAHSSAWGGLSFGRYSAAEVRDFYLDHGYDVPVVTNYEQIYLPESGRGIPLTGYEHGFNPGQRHQTVLNPREVSFYDFPFYQGLRQKQAVLDRLDEPGVFVIVNHPTKDGAYTVEDMRSLTSYEGIEVATKYSRATEHWDAALSSGHPVWGFCQDDGHDLSRASHTEIAWSMVAARERSVEGVLDALREGRFYGVWTREKDPPNALVSCTLADGVLEVVVRDPADRIRFIGQGGRVLAEEAAADRARYALRDADTYVRVEVETGRTELLLNPVLRHSGDPLTCERAEVLPGATWGLRAIAAVAFAVLVALALRRWRGLPGRPRSSQLDHVSASRDEHAP